LAQQNQQPLSLETSLKAWQKAPTSIHNRQAAVQGYFQTDPVLLHDNRIRQGKPGYNIFYIYTLSEPFQNYTHILINVGWHPSSFDRSMLPDITLKRKSLLQASNMVVTLEHIYPNVFTLETGPPEQLSQHNKPIIRMQTINFTQLDTLLHTKNLPFIGRTSEPLTSPALQHTEINSYGPTAAKHFGYAFQWFIFWCIALGVFLYTQFSWYDRASKDINLHQDK